MSKNPIMANTTVEEIVREYPQLVRPLMEYGIKCVACGEPLWGTLAENADQKGIDNLDEILEKLNRIVLKDRQVRYE